MAMKEYASGYNLDRVGFQSFLVFSFFFLHILVIEVGLSFSFPEKYFGNLKAKSEGGSLDTNVLLAAGVGRL